MTEEHALELIESTIEDAQEMLSVGCGLEALDILKSVTESKEIHEALGEWFDDDE